MSKPTQYFIESTTVTCCLFNEKDVAFMASSELEGEDFNAAMKEALAKATASMEAYNNG